ncbi:flippase [Novosphingobium resinovorum]|uniref:flippase n=1 Tax=Novosphingobium resinovorum TaxID=158500 RepID=UPI002ED2B096
MKSYLSNSAWLMADNLFTNAVTFIVFVGVARYYGADQYGAYAYVFAIAQLFAVLGQMGLDGLLIRDLVDNPDDHPRVLGTGGGLRFAGYCIGGLGCLIYGLVMPQHDSTERWLFFSAFLFILFTPAPMLLDNWFRSRVEARYSTIARMAGTLIGGLARGIVILLGGSIIIMGYVQAASVLIIVAVSLPLFLRRGGPAPHRWVFDPKKARAMLSESWMIFLGSAMALIYLKIDQVMLRWWEGPAEVGIYAVAARLSEVFYFIPAALVTSFFPRLIQLHKQEREVFNARFESLLALLALLAYAIMIGIFLFGPLLIKFAFGQQFEAAGPVLMVHMCSMPFIFMRYAFSRWMVVERFNVFSVISQGCGAIANVLLNIVLIPRYGMMGSAVATLISYAAASYFILLVSPRTRPIFFLMTKALFKPWVAIETVNSIRSAKRA